MSFSFKVKPNGDSWEKRGDATVRTLKRGGCELLRDVSPVTFPAYEETSVSVEARSMAEAMAKEGGQADADQETRGDDEQALIRRRRRARELELIELRGVQK